MREASKLFINVETLHRLSATMVAVAERRSALEEAEEASEAEIAQLEIIPLVLIKGNNESNEDNCIQGYFFFQIAARIFLQ